MNITGKYYKPSMPNGRDGTHGTDMKNKHIGSSFDDFLKSEEEGKMRQDLTDITVVLDRSGSMAVVANDTKHGFDQFVRDQREAPGDAVLTLVQFDTDYEFIHKARNIQDVPELKFKPRGLTALLDAVGKAIVETGERLSKMAEYERPGKVVFVIMTDGEENSSKEYTKAQINEMISKQSNVYKWQFVFLGANQDAIQAGVSYGIDATNSINFAHTGKGTTNVFAATSSNLKSYRAGTCDNMSYSDVDREKTMED